MNYPHRIIFFAAIPMLFCCCSSSKGVVQAQLQVHQDFIEYFQRIVTQVEKQGQSYIQQLGTQYSLSENCKNYDPNPVVSSLYVPVSAKTGQKLDCFFQATSNFDGEWETFYNHTGYISWQYFYDDESKGLRIHPSTNTEALFGKDLTFESFHFYKGAIDSYPEGTWSRIQEDVNGTGKILIYSQATKLQGNANYTVIGLDVRANGILNRFQNRILDFTQRYQLKHGFIYSYSFENGARTIAHEYSTNPPLWQILKPLKGQLLNRPVLELQPLLEAEKAVWQGDINLKLLMVKIDRANYSCSLSKLSRPQILTLFCWGPL